MQSVSISETQYLFSAMNKTGIKNEQESNMNKTYQCTQELEKGIL